MRKVWWICLTRENFKKSLGVSIYSSYWDKSRLLSYVYDFQLALQQPCIELFDLSNLLQTPNKCRVIHVEFISNFLYSLMRIVLDYFLQLVIINFRWLSMAIFRPSSPSSLSSAIRNFWKQNCTGHLWKNLWLKVSLTLWFIFYVFRPSLYS